jgi:hypothetical protein
MDVLQDITLKQDFEDIDYVQCLNNCNLDIKLALFLKIGKNQVFLKIKIFIYQKM